MHSDGGMLPVCFSFWRHCRHNTGSFPEDSLFFSGREPYFFCSRFVSPFFFFCEAANCFHLRRRAQVHSGELLVCDNLVLHESEVYERIYLTYIHHHVTCCSSGIEYPLFCLLLFFY